MKLVKYAISLFIVLSFFTRTLTTASEGVFGRITLSDLFGGVALLLFFILNRKIKLAATNKANFIFFLLVLPGFWVSAAPLSTLVELLILFFLMLLAITMYQVFNSIKGLEKLIFLFSVSGMLASLTGIWDTFAMFTPLPRIFPARAIGESLSGFRNAGQAGAFMLVVLTVLIPLRGSKLFNTFQLKTKNTIKLSIIFSSIFLLLTGKIAAYIGIGFGFIFYLVLRRKFILLVPLSIFFGLFLLILPYAEIIAPAVYNRINYKINDRIVKNIGGERNISEQGFIASNLKHAIMAFEDHPLTGSGLGGISAAGYDRHEIHSTYFKMIGETGLLGVIGYCYFMFIFIKLFYLKDYKNGNPYRHYLKLMFPFIIGCFISWGYTYHIRKREFYILLTIVNITYFLAKNYNIKNLEIKKA